MPTVISVPCLIRSPTHFSETVAHFLCFHFYQLEHSYFGASCRWVAVVAQVLASTRVHMFPVGSKMLLHHSTPDW